MECSHPFIWCDNATEHTLPHITRLEYGIRITSLLIIIILIFLSNSLILAVLWTGRHVPRNTKYLMTSLCVTDILLGFLVGCALVSACFDRWLFGDVLCRIISNLYQITLTVTLASYLLLLIDKYISIGYPLKHPTIMSSRNTVVAILCCWTLSAAVIIISSNLYSVENRYYSNIYTCFITYRSIEESVSSLISISFTGLLPVILITVFCNVHIYVIVQRHRRKLSPASSVAGSTDTPTMTKNTKGLKTILLGTITIFICWEPIVIIRCLALISDLDIPHIVVFFVVMLIFSNSFCNWIIYTKTHSLFKKDQTLLIRRIEAFFASRLS